MSRKGISWSNELVTEIPPEVVDYDEYTDEGSFEFDELSPDDPDAARYVSFQFDANKKQTILLLTAHCLLFSDFSRMIQMK